MENMEFNKETVTLASESDIESITRLQRKNLDKNLTEEEKQKEGFVSLETTNDDLSKIMENKDGLIVVDKQNDHLRGYLISITQEYAKKLSFLDPLLQNIKELEYQGKKIEDYKYCILAQTAIEKESRGQGILEKLYAKLKNELATQGYELGISEIAESNEKSLGVHLNKIGLKKIGVYDFDNKKWVVVALDLIKKQNN